MKSDTEEEMNEILSENKQRASVSNTMFNKILDNVGYKQNDMTNVVEQLLPTEYYISHEYIETNRKEVRGL